MIYGGSTALSPKVLQYKWEDYCDTNGRKTVRTEIILLIPSPNLFGNLFEFFRGVQSFTECFCSSFSTNLTHPGFSEPFL